MADTTLRDPHRTPLLIEFWTHASRNERLRLRASAAHEQLLEGYGLLITELAELFTAHVLSFTRPRAGTD